MKTKKVTKAVIAAAGLGTRFLPQTKAMPKEMLPIMGKPIIQWVVEELVDVGVTDIIIVTGAQKRAIEDHFDRSLELEEGLIANGKAEAAKEIKDIAELANFIYIRQKAFGEKAYGTAIPLLNAEHLIGDEPFFYVSADDLFISSGESRAKQMLNAYKKTGKTVMAALKIDKKDSAKYGMIDVGEKITKSLFRVNGLIEKPEPKDAPSDIMSICWYLLTPNIFDKLGDLELGKGGELWAIDAIADMIGDDKIYAQVLEGTYHDCGNYVNYLKASLHFASQHEEINVDIAKYVEDTIFNNKAKVKTK